MMASLDNCKKRITAVIETSGVGTKKTTSIVKQKMNEAKALNKANGISTENGEYLELRKRRILSKDEEENSEDSDSMDEQVLTANIRTNPFILHDIVPNSVLGSSDVLGFGNLPNINSPYKFMTSKFLNKMRLTKIQTILSNQGDPNILAHIEAFNCGRVKFYESLVCACGHISSAFDENQHQENCDFLKKYKR